MKKLIELSKVIRDKFEPTREPAKLRVWWLLEDKVFEIRKVQRPDTYSEAETRIGTISVSFMKRFRSMLERFRDPPPESLLPAKKVHSKYKMRASEIASLIIEEFDVRLDDESRRVTPAELLSRSSMYDQYYYWPMCIMQAMEYVRFGNVSWLLNSFEVRLAKESIVERTYYCNEASELSA